MVIGYGFQLSSKEGVPPQEADPTLGMETTNQEGVNMEKSNIVDWYPLVNVYITMENHHAINGKIQYKWQFSIAMLNYQRVIPLENHGFSYANLL